MTLKDQIEELFSKERGRADRSEVLKAFSELKFFLNEGEVRAAQPSRTASATGGWIVNSWVRKGILLGFRAGELVSLTSGEPVHYFDKNTVPVRKLTLEDGVRLVPGGSTIRDGTFVAKGVVVMPPSYVNIGAYVDEGTMIDSHVLVGSCAQIGKRVHLSSGCQIGGVLEPPGEFPVILEDNVFVGGLSGVFDGTIVKRRAVIGAGVTLTGSTAVYDLVHSTVRRRASGSPLVIPEGAVLVQGSRPIDGDFARKHGLAVNTPIIIKYRNESTDAATALTEDLR